MNSKKKGNRGEREVAQYLRDCGLDNTAARNWSSGSDRNKSDIHNSLDWNLEVKRVEKLNIWKALEQVEEYSRQNHAKPSVVFRRNRTPEWYIAIRLSDWVDLLKSKKRSELTEAPERAFDSKDAYYKLNNLKNAVKAVQKILDETF